MQEFDCVNTEISIISKSDALKENGGINHVCILHTNREVTCIVNDLEIEMQVSS